MSVASADPLTILRRGLMADVMRTCADWVAAHAHRKLLGIVVGGRATGNQLPLVAKELGFKIVHIYPKGLSASITASFADNFDYPPMVFDPNSPLSSLTDQVRALAKQQGLSVSGFIAGMDYGVEAADFLNSAFSTPGNTPNLWRTNKGLLNDHLESHGVPVVRSQTFNLEDIADGIRNREFPVFIKPVSSFASIGAGCCETRDHLQSVLDKMIAETKRMQLTVKQAVVEDFLHPNTIYFANTINAQIKGTQKRIVTGLAVDTRGDDFSKEVWDLILMLPPPHLLAEQDRRLFNFMLEANKLVLNKSGTNVGSSHLEFMARSTKIESAADLLPIDLNLRLPGLDFPRLELQATGIDPYILGILAHTHPELLERFPELYSGWRQSVGLIFLRSHWNGTVSKRGTEWLNSLYNNPNARPDGAHFTRVLVPGAGSPVVKTTDGSTMEGVMHAVAPTVEALHALYREVREKERARFFVD